MKKRKKEEKRRKRKFLAAKRGSSELVKLVLPEAMASKTTLKLMGEIEQLVLKIDKQNHLIHQYLHDMVDPPEQVGEKLMRERAVLEVLRIRLDQKKFEFEEAQVADAEAQLEQIERHHCRLQEEKIKVEGVVHQKLCELYPSQEAKRLLKDPSFRNTCPITAPLIRDIQEAEQRLRTSQELVRRLRSDFYMNREPSNGEAHTNGSARRVDFQPAMVAAA